MKRFRHIYFVFLIFSLVFSACENDADGDFDEVAKAKSKTLPTPTNFTATYDPQTNKTNFTWDAVDGATGYSILEYTKNDSLYALKVLNPPSTSGSIYGYSASVGTYYYWLLAYNNSEESELTAVQQITTTAVSPNDVKVTSVSNGIVSLSWTEIEGITGYKVSYKKEGESAYTEFDTVLTSAGAVITLSEYAPKITYKVRSLKGASLSEDIYGDDGTTILNEATAEIGLFAPRNLSASKTDTYGSISLSWNKISGVTGYKIYSGREKDGTDAALQGTTENNETVSYTLTGLDRGTHYFFVSTINSSDETEDESGLSTAASAKILLWYPEDITVSERTETSLTLTWKTVEGAEKYTFTVTDEDGTTISGIENVAATDTTKTIAGLSSGKSYSIKMQSIDSDGEAGEMSDTLNAKTNIAKPEIAAANSICYATSAVISWESVVGATSYEVRYSETNNVDSATSITDITDNYCEIPNLKKSTMYYFWLRAIDAENGDENDVYKTDWDAERSPTVSRPTNIKITESGNLYILSWSVDGDAASKYRVRYCTKLSDSSTVDLSTVTVVDNTITNTVYDVSNILNNRDDSVLYYYFTVDAYCDLDEKWYQGSDEDGYGWYGDGFSYGEKSQVPTSANLLSTRTSYSNYGFPSGSYKYTYSSTSTSTVTYFYFKATKGKKYTIYYADKYDNTGASLGSYTTKADIISTWYTAGGTASSYGDYQYQSFTCIYDSYIVIAVKKYSGSTYGAYGVQVVESN